MNYEELKQENERLRRKLSPLEDPKFTQMLGMKLAGIDLRDNYQRLFRKKNYIVVTPGEIADLCGLPRELPVLTNIGRSLQAMCWERSALHGNLVFVMPLKEYEDGIQ